MGESSTWRPGTAGQRILDELLVLRVREGSRDAFEQLVARWQERLWRHARHLTGHDDAAWDVIQESWIAITRGIAKLDDPGAFRRWAYTIVTRTAIADARRRPREVPVADESLDARPAADAGDEREQAMGLLRAALEQLPGERRVLLSLRYLEEFELAEIADILGIPEGTVGSRLHHAKKQLKETLERSER